MISALDYVSLLGLYVEFERIDGEDDMNAAGVVAAVSDYRPGEVVITFLSDACIRIRGDQVWQVAVWQRAPHLAFTDLMAAAAAADAAATTYGDERYGHPDPDPMGDGESVGPAETHG